MKYLVILGDGMADYPCEALQGKTPLEVAQKPNIDRLCSMGTIGLAKTVPDGMKPGSDVANLSMMGYRPDKYYTGRSPLEALSIGIDMKDGDIATRCNLVTLSDSANFEDKVMVDYSAGEISTEEAKELIEAVQEHFGGGKYDFWAGVSYRHCMITHHAKLGMDYTPPHDISDKVIGEYLPKGKDGKKILQMMKESYDFLSEHPVNKKRVEEGKNPANCIWLWGEGTKPDLDNFQQKYGLKAAVISAVDLVKGIGIGAGMTSFDVEGATGTYKTNFFGKARQAIDAFKDGYDYVYIHMEAPDECGHQGDLDNKIKSIELIDKMVVGYCVEQLDILGEDYRILIAPDHPTPICTRTHASDPVPFVLYDSTDIKQNAVTTYNENTAKESGLLYDPCQDLIDKFLSKPADQQEPVQESENADEGAEKTQEVVTESEVVEESVADNTAEPPVEEIHDHTPPKAKKKMDAKQKKITVIAVLCIVAVVALSLGIGLPIYFHFKDKIMVDSADDFGNIEKGKYFVLSKDVTVDGDLDMSKLGNYSIDLQGHTLTVKGKLTYQTDDAKDIQIGKTKKKQYIQGGGLVANEIVLSTPNANVSLLSSTQGQKVTISAKKVTLGGMTASDGINIESNKLDVVGNISTSSTAKVEIANCDATISANVESSIKAVNSQLLVKGGSAVDSVELDSLSTAQISGQIKNGISGGKKVAMLPGHKCQEYIGITTLALYREGASDYTIKSCGKIVYIDRLVKPAEMLVEERGEGVVVAVATKVPHATQYIFEVDGNQYTSDTNEFDVSFIMAQGQVGKHEIVVYAKGNYDFDGLDAVEDKVVYLDSDKNNMSYTYKITLSTPENIQLEESEGKVFLKFNTVKFADYYTVSIGGKESKFDTQKGSVQSFDITDKITEVGSYSIRVSAHSKVAEILGSKQALATFNKYQKLDAPTSVVAKSNSTLLNVSWVESPNAKGYVIYAKIDGVVTEVGRTSMLSFSIDKTVIGNASEVMVKAEGFGYWLESDMTTATIVAE